MEKIKVCFVETNCKKNGPIKQTYNIIKYMDRNVFEPSLVTVWPEESDNTMLREYKELGINAYCANLQKTSSIFCGRKQIGKILKKIAPHIVQGVGIPPYRMTLGYKNAVHFVTLRNYCYEDYPDQYGKTVGSIMARIDMGLIKRRLKAGEPFVTCSESLTMMYRERQGIEIPFICNGVDTMHYSKRVYEQHSVIRRQLGLPVNKKILVYSGGLIDRKNQRECIAGFLKSKSSGRAVLLLLGDGSDKELLEKEYKNYSNISFMGKVSNVTEFLHAADGYISTSKSEGLPNGVLEAMACGVPVILSDIPQHLEVIKGNQSCGLSYHLGDIDDLAGKIDLFFSQDLVEMGNQAYETVRNNFTAEGMSKRYQEVYLNLVKRQKGS